MHTREDRKKCILGTEGVDALTLKNNEKVAEYMMWADEKVIKKVVIRNLGKRPREMFRQRLLDMVK